MSAGPPAAAPAGPVAVVKLGGEVAADPARLGPLFADVRALVARGWRVAVCHGGGPQLDALQARLGVPIQRVGGRRITDDTTLQVVKLVLAGEVNVDLVAAAAGAGLAAVGLSGASAGLVTARRRPPIAVSGGGPEPIDFGHVGEIVAVRPALLQHLWAGGYTPIVSTLGIDAPPADGGPCPVYNINADTVASTLAATLEADHLFLVSGVPGVLADKDDPSTRLPRLDRAAARAAIADGTLTGGMIPKVEEALRQLDRGVRAVHILGADPGALAAEAATPGSAGTALVP